MTSYHALASQLKERLASSEGSLVQVHMVHMVSAPIGAGLDIATRLSLELGGQFEVNLYAACPVSVVKTLNSHLSGSGVAALPGVYRVRVTETVVLTLRVCNDASEGLGWLEDMPGKCDVAIVEGTGRLDCRWLVDSGWAGNECWLVEFPEISVRKITISANEAQGSFGGKLGPRTVMRSGDDVAVIGAGIAGMTLAHVLSAGGFKVTVIDSVDPLSGQGTHSGHLAAALTPVVSADDNVRSRLSRAGALAADRLWRNLSPEIGKRCGALQLERLQGERRRVGLAQVADSFGYPEWAQWLDPVKASEIAGVRLDRAALWLPGGWLVKVESLIKELGAGIRVGFVQSFADRLIREAGLWKVVDGHGQVVSSAKAVIVANAGDSTRLLANSGLLTDQSTVDSKVQRLSSMHRLAGEITAIPANLLHGGPNCIVGGDGYVLPAVDGWCISGGTYVRGTVDAHTTEQGKRGNVERAASLLAMPELPDVLGPSSRVFQQLPGWSGWRAVVAGRLPVVGPVGDADGVYVSTAGASRGLTWSVLMAELIRDHLQGRFPALEHDLLRAISWA